MNILFLVHRYGLSDGISVALREYAQTLPATDSYTVATRWVLSQGPDFPVTPVGSRRDLEALILNGNFDVIHYFKAANYDLFNWTLATMRRIKRNIPIITTICQRPSFPTLLLSPAEIKHSSKIVLIDNTAFNDPLISFIPTTKKAKIHMGVSQEVFDKTAHILQHIVPSTSKGGKDEPPVVFGRGSTLGKCPKNIIDVFDNIEIPNKHFVIVGVTPDSWLGEKVKGRQDITLLPLLPFDKWLETCSQFDVFLYQLPKDTHASMDNTLAHAMLMEKACVYEGSEPPKERFENGTNGFVAQTPQEASDMATRVGRDPQLRREVGRKARLSTLRDFTMTAMVERYRTLYQKIANESLEGHQHQTAVPLSYRLHFLRNSAKPLLKTLLAGTALERAYRRRHPLPRS